MTARSPRPPRDRTDVTDLLDAWYAGSASAAEELFDAVYPVLRAIAGQYVGSPGCSPLSVTELVHEAYLKLRAQRSVRWQNRSHFFGVAAIVVRRILVDEARRVRSDKRGGTMIRLTLEEAEVATEPDVDILALSHALDRLHLQDPAASHVVHLRYFAGLSLLETARVLGFGRTKVGDLWRYARAWLHQELTAAMPDHPR